MHPHEWYYNPFDDYSSNDSWVRTDQDRQDYEYEQAYREAEASHKYTEYLRHYETPEDKKVRLDRDQGLEDKYRLDAENKHRDKVLAQQRQARLDRAKSKQAIYREFYATNTAQVLTNPIHKRLAYSTEHYLQTDTLDPETLDTFSQFLYADKHQEVKAAYQDAALRRAKAVGVMSHTLGMPGFVLEQRVAKNTPLLDTYGPSHRTHLPHELSGVQSRFYDPVSDQTYYSKDMYTRHLAAMSSMFNEPSQFRDRQLAVMLAMDLESETSHT